MDPVTALGAAGSVVGIASFGLQLCQALYQFTAEAKSANESLVAVLSGIQATTLALNQVHGFLKEEVEHLKTKKQATFFSPTSINAVKKTADECLVIFWKIEATIAHKSHSNIEEKLIAKLNEFNEALIKQESPPPIITDKKLTSMSIWNRLRWPMITYKLDQFNSQLQSRQANLNLIFTVVSLGAQRVKPNQRQEDLKFVAETYSKIRRMVAQGELPQFEFIEEHRMKRDSYTRTRPRLESPADDKFRADSLPVGVKANIFRRSSPSPSRHLSPLRYQPVVSSRGLGRSKDSPARHYDHESEIRRSSLSHVPSRRGNQAISVDTREGIGQKDPIIQFDGTDRKSTNNSIKTETLSPSAMVSGGRSENDQIHLNDGIDHVYEKVIGSPISPVESNGARQSSQVKPQVESLATAVDVLDPIVETSTAEYPDPEEEPRAETVVLGEAIDTQAIVSPVPKTLANNETGTRNTNGEILVSTSRGDQTGLSAPTNPDRPAKDSMLPKANTSFEAKGSHAEIPILSPPEIILEAPSQSSSQFPVENQSKTNDSVHDEPLDNSMALVRYVPKESSTQDQTSERNFSLRSPFQSSENVPIVEVTSSEFGRIHRESRRQSRREERARRWASQAARTATSEDTRSITTTYLSSSEKVIISRHKRFRFQISPLLKALFQGKEKKPAYNVSSEGTIERKEEETAYDISSEGTVQRPRHISLFESLFHAKEATYEAVVSAYIIKNGKGHQVPHSGTLSLTRQQFNNLDSQSSKQPWYKIFAFLADEDRDALKRILAQADSDDGVRRTIVHLEKVREDRPKFWKAKNQALLALITDLFPEAPYVGDLSTQSLADSDYNPPSRNRVKIRQESPPRTTSYNIPTNPGVSFPPAVPGPPPRPFQDAPGMMRLGPPPPPPLPRAPAPGQQRVPGPPPLPLGAIPPGSTVVRDITARQVLDEATCRKRLTTYMFYGIRKSPPRNPTETATWARSDITQEKLSQADILKHIKQLDTGSETVTQKKAELGYYQQSQITHLLDNLTMKEIDRNFEWLLIQLDRVERPIQGTKNKRETTTMLVFLKRAPLASLSAITLLQNLDRSKQQNLRPPPPPSGGQPTFGSPGVQSQQIPPTPKQSGSGPDVIKVGNKASTSKSKSKKWRYDSSFDSDSEFSGYSSTLSSTSRNLRRRSSSRKKRYRAGSPVRSRSRSRFDKSSGARSRQNFPGDVPYDDPVAAAYRVGKMDGEADMRPVGRRRAVPPPSYGPRSYYDHDYGPVRNPYAPEPVRSAYAPEIPRPRLVDPYNPSNPRPSQYVVPRAPEYQATNTAARYEREKVDQPIVARPEMGPLATNKWLNEENMRLDEISRVRRSDDKPANAKSPAAADKNEKDIVQRLLLQWTPRNGEEDNEDSGSEMEDNNQPRPVENKAGPELTSPHSTAPTARSLSPQNDSRQATVDEVLDEADKNWTRHKPNDVLSEDGNMIFPERGRQFSPKPISKPRAKSADGSKPSWLDPDWAKKIVDTTSKNVEPPKRRETTNFENSEFPKAPNVDPVAAAYEAGKIDADAERFGVADWERNRAMPPPPPPLPRPVVDEQDMPIYVRPGRADWAREDERWRDEELRQAERELEMERARMRSRERERRAEDYIDRPRVSYNQSTLDREEARMRDLEREERIRRQDEEIRRRNPIPRRGTGDEYYEPYGYEEELRAGGRYREPRFIPEPRVVPIAPTRRPSHLPRRYVPSDDSFGGGW